MLQNRSMEHRHQLLACDTSSIAARQCTQLVPYRPVTANTRAALHEVGPILTCTPEPEQPVSGCGACRVRVQLGGLGVFLARQQPLLTAPDDTGIVSTQSKLNPARGEMTISG